MPSPAERVGPRWGNASRAIFAAAIACVIQAPILAPADDWPQWRGPGRDGVWKETGIIREFPAPRVKLRWRAEISSGYSGPTVASGRGYVTDRLAAPREVERVHCFDADDGRKIWTHAYGAAYRRVSYTAGPRASVSIDDGRAYALGTMGHLHRLDASSGERIWEDLTAVPKARWSNIHMVRNGERIWMFNERGGVCWSHPAFAYRCVFARNDRELICASLAVPGGP